MIELTDQTFEEILKSADKPVLVDFWAEWCTPCQMLSPALEKLEKEYKDKIIFAKLNIDVAPTTASNYQVNQIPTIMLFKEAKPISGFLGLKPAEAIKEWLDKELSMGNDEREVGQLIEEYTAYANEKGFLLNPDQNIVIRTIQGLLKNEKQHGKRYCPCRRLSGNDEEDEKIVCPCYYHEKEIKEVGYCTCHLFVKK